VEGSIWWKSKREVHLAIMNELLIQWIVFLDSTWILNIKA
jgi:hypothetical protein